jgi:hypothetical protein
VASGNALKLSLHYFCANLSYYDLPKLTFRATPEMYSNYKLTTQLFITFNNINHHQERTQLNCHDLYLNSTMKNNKSKIGLNILSNLFILNDQVPLDWFNESLNYFKISCKEKFLALK